MNVWGNTLILKSEPSRATKRFSAIHNRLEVCFKLLFPSQRWARLYSIFLVSERHIISRVHSLFLSRSKNKLSALSHRRQRRVEHELFILIIHSHFIIQHQSLSIPSQFTWLLANSLSWWTERKSLNQEASVKIRSIQDSIHLFFYKPIDQQPNSLTNENYKFIPRFTDPSENVYWSRVNDNEQLE